MNKAGRERRKDTNQCLEGPSTGVSKLFLASRHPPQILHTVQTSPITWKGPVIIF